MYIFAMHGFMTMKGKSAKEQHKKEEEYEGNAEFVGALFVRHYSRSAAREVPRADSDMDDNSHWRAVLPVGSGVVRHIFRRPPQQRHATGVRRQR